MARNVGFSFFRSAESRGHAAFSAALRSFTNRCLVVTPLNPPANPHATLSNRLLSRHADAPMREEQLPQLPDCRAFLDQERSAAAWYRRRIGRRDLFGVFLERRVP